MTTFSLSNLAESICGVFKMHAAILGGPSHVPKSVYSQSYSLTSLHSHVPEPAYSHSSTGTPLYPLQLTSLHSHVPEPAYSQSSAGTPLRPHSLTSLHSHVPEPAYSQSSAGTLTDSQSSETTPLYPSETTCSHSSKLCSIFLKNVIKMLQNFLDTNVSIYGASVIIFDYCHLLHVCHRIESPGHMSLKTVKELLISYVESEFSECDDIRNHIVEIFVKNLCDFNTTPSEHTFKALVFSMETVDVIYSINRINNLMYRSLSLVNGKVYINYGIQKSPSVPCITLRERLYPDVTPMFIII